MVTHIDDARRRHHGPAAGARVPPHNLQAEESLLGAMLITPAAIAAAVDAGLDPDDFYKPAHGHLFAIARDLAERGVAVDAVTVDQEVRRRGLPPEIGGANLITLQAGVPALGNAGRYARIIAEHSLMRQFIAAASDMADVGYGLPTDLDAAIDQATERFASLRARNDELGGGSSWEPVDLAAALAGEVGDKPTFMVRADGEPLLYADKIHAFNAEPESGKSLLGQWVALERLAAGEHVLYVDFEAGPIDVVNRLLDMGGDPTSILERFHYVRPDHAVDAGARRRIVDMLRQWPVTFCVVDGVAEALALSGLDENKGTDIISFYVALPRLISHLGVCVVVIDHVVKDKENQGRYARGSGAKLAAIDGAAFKLEVVKPFGRGLHGIARLVVTKDRHGWVRRIAGGGTLAAEFHGISDPETNHLTIELRASTALDAEGHFRPTVLMERVSHALANAAGPVSAAWVGRVVPGKPGHLRAAIDALVSEGYVRTVGSALVFIRPFGEPLPEPPDEDF